MMMTGIKLVQVPYKTNCIIDLLSGQVPLAFTPIAPVIEFIRDGRLRIIAVTTATRSELLPAALAIGEFVPRPCRRRLVRICALRATWANVVDKLATTIVAIDTEPEYQARLTALGIDPAPMNTAEFGNFVADETEK